MTRPTSTAPPVTPLGPALRALAGVVAALAAVGVGHGMAAIINPPAAPIIAVGSVLIDAAPTPAKEFAVRTFGTYDKPILISSIGVVLLIFAVALGLIAWRRRLLSSIGISLLGVAGIAAAVYRGSAIDAIPSLVAGAVGVAALSIITSLRPDPTEAPDQLAQAGTCSARNPIRSGCLTRPGDGSCSGWVAPSCSRPSPAGAASSSNASVRPARRRDEWWGFRRPGPRRRTGVLLLIRRRLHLSRRTRRSATAATR